MILNGNINIRHRYASSPSLHGPLVWDYTEYTHRGEVRVTDMSNFAMVLDKIGLRRLEGQRLQTAQKEQGLAHVLPEQQQQLQQGLRGGLLRGHAVDGGRNKEIQTK